jgi:hypothetical protein
MHRSSRHDDIFPDRPTTGLAVLRDLWQGAFFRCWDGCAQALPFAHTESKTDPPATQKRYGFRNNPLKPTAVFSFLKSFGSALIPHCAGILRSSTPATAQAAVAGDPGRSG